MQWGWLARLFSSAALYMLVNHWKGYLIFPVLLAFYPVGSIAVDFSQCFADVTSCAQNSSNCSLGISNTTALSALRTSQGDHVTSPDTATALLYSACTTYCGTGRQDFSWTDFSQKYAAWLLPYLALVSQLPYGAPRRMDNLMSALLTLGSPTLAGYSLYMTLLNARWVNDQLFAGINYPSAAVRRSVVRVLSSLQQVPLRIHPGESGRFESLVVHPDNDIWWTVFADELGDFRKWSIASAASIAWVAIAYLLTAADSISNVINNIQSNGQATGSGLLWLLPVVVGWLVLSPKCDYRRVHDAYHKANQRAFVADPNNRNAPPIPVTSNFGLTICPYPNPSYAKGISSPDELRIPPVFNYARVLSWSRSVYLTSLYYHAAWRKSTDRASVDEKEIPGNVRNDVPRVSRLGTREETINYCQPDNLKHLGNGALWPSGLVFNMVVASLMSLLLQWGTTFGAFLADWYTPTVGLGCRSLVQLMYGTVSTLVWILLVFSNILGDYAHHLLESRTSIDLEKAGGRVFSSSSSSTPSRHHHPRISPGQSDLVVRPVGTQGANSPAEGIDLPFDIRSSAQMVASIVKLYRRRGNCGRVLLRIADWFRWIGKALAIVNAIGIIANSVFQYAGMYTSCYCDANVWTWPRVLAFYVISPNSSDIDLTRGAWIGALSLSLISCSLFVGSMYLVRDTLPS